MYSVFSIFVAFVWPLGLLGVSVDEEDPHNVNDSSRIRVGDFSCCTPCDTPPESPRKRVCISTGCS